MTRSVERPGTWLASWRVCLRMAHRDVLRAKSRSALVVAMVGIPITLVSALAVFYRTTNLTPTEETLASLGAADAMLRVVSAEPITQDAFGNPTPPPDDQEFAVRQVPAGVAELIDAELLVRRQGRTVVGTETGALGATALELDLREPAAAGLGSVVEGRAPDSPDEVLVSPVLVERGFAPGDELRLGEDRRRLTVVGVVTRTGFDPDAEVVAGLPGALLAGDQVGYAATLADTGGRPVTRDDIERLNEYGISVVSRAVVRDAPASERPEPSASAEEAGILLLVVVVVTIEVVLLAGPAFAVGVRRRTRQLALVAATGGTARHVRRVVLAHAAVLGFGSAVAGALLGIGLFALARPWLSQVATGLYPVRIEPAHLAALVLAGTAAAVAAALVPARQAARQDPVAALAGRPGRVRARRGLPLVGVVLAGGGTAGVLAGARQGSGGEALVAGGTSVVVLGAILVLPTAVGLVGRLGARLPPALRMATRDASRQQGRTAPAIAAIMGVVAGMTVFAIGINSDTAEQRRDYRPMLPLGAMAANLYQISAAEAKQLSGRIAQAVPGSSPLIAYEPKAQLVGSDGSQGAEPERSRSFALRIPACEGRPDPASCTRERLSNQTSHDLASWIGFTFYGVLVADAETVAAFTGEPLSAGLRETLERGGVLVADHGAIARDGTVPVVTYEKAQGGGPPDSAGRRELRLPAAPLPRLRERRTVHLAVTVMTPETARRLDLDPVPSRILVPPTAGGISVEQEEQVAELALAAMPEAGAGVDVERGFEQDYTGPIFAIMGGLATLVLLVGTATATALAIDDARPDFATLSAIGASPRTRRRMAMGQAAVVAGLGALFGVLVGAVPGVAVTWPMTVTSYGGHLLDVPWGFLALVVVGVPLLAVLGAGLFTRSALPLVRRLG